MGFLNKKQEDQPKIIVQQEKQEYIDPTKRIRKPNTKYFNESYVNAVKSKPPVADDSNISIKQALREMPEAANECIKKELKQIVEMGAMVPNKAFDKLKARLVVRGDMQYKNPWSNTPKAPTVAQASGAYLNADTPENDKEIVLIDTEETKILIDLYPAMKSFVRSDGKMMMQVEKAMYGMLNSARYWYENIRDTMINGGYKQNASDECVFMFNDENGNQSIVDLWVDDLTVACNLKKI